MPARQLRTTASVEWVPPSDRWHQTKPNEPSLPFTALGNTWRQQAPSGSKPTNLALASPSRSSCVTSIAKDLIYTGGGCKYPGGCVFRIEARRVCGTNSGRQLQRPSERLEVAWRSSCTLRRCGPDTLSHLCYSHSGTLMRAAFATVDGTCQTTDFATASCASNP